MARLRGLLGPIAVAVGLLAVLEFGARSVAPGGSDFARFVFWHTMNLARWEFLDSNAQGLVMEVVHKYQPGLVERREPEDDRPPFDRVDRNYDLQINARGYRDPDWSVTPAPDRRRILVVGDSVAFGKGLQVGERFTDRINATSPRFELVNLGVEACRADCMLRALDEVSDLEADLVLIQASGNDVDQVLWAQATSSGARPGLLARLAARSRLLLRLRFELYGDDQSGSWDEAVGATADSAGPLYTQLLDKIAARGARAIVLSLPYATGQLHSAYVGQLCAARSDVCLGTVQPEFPAVVDGEPPAWVTESADVLSVPVEAVSAIFPMAAYTYDFVHLNVEGNRIVATALQRFLEDLPDPRTPDPGTSRTP